MKVAKRGERLGYNSFDLHLYPGFVSVHATAKRRGGDILHLIIAFLHPVFGRQRLAEHDVFALKAAG